jgi:hypothetical protein
MLKLPLTIVQTLTILYLAGDQNRQNPTIDEAINIIEGGYTKFNKSLKESSISSLLDKLRLFYGWLSGISFGFIILLAYTTEASSKWVHSLLLIISSTFFISLLNSVAISWCMYHRKNIKNLLSFAVYIFAILILAVVVDMINPDEPLLIPLIFASLAPLLGLLGLSADSFNHPIVQMVVISAFMLIYLFTVYVGMWLISAPLTFASAVVLACPVYFARTIEYFWPKQNLVGLCMILNIVIILWQAAL